MFPIQSSHRAQSQRRLQPHPHPHPDPDALATVRHDLRTPLCVIKGSAQLVARDVGRAPSLTDAERERLHRHLSAINVAVDALTDQIDGLRFGDGAAADPRPNG
jgi:nitrogen-specific signal transduction histidine kinase